MEMSRKYSYKKPLDAKMPMNVNIGG